MAVSCGVSRRRGLDPELLWLRRGPAAVALIQPLSLGTSTCHGCGPKKSKNKNKNKNPIDLVSGAWVLSSTT